MKRRIAGLVLGVIAGVGIVSLFGYILCQIFLEKSQYVERAPYIALNSVALLFGIMSLTGVLLALKKPLLSAIVTLSSCAAPFVEIALALKRPGEEAGFIVILISAVYIVGVPLLVASGILTLVSRKSFVLKEKSSV
jgi:hypothetical protein